MTTGRKTLAMVAEHANHPDGSVTVRPVAVADDREIGAACAARLPGFKGREKVPLIWESELVRREDGRVEVMQREPVKYLTRRQAAEMLGVSAWTVADLFRMGLIVGDKPGDKRARKDGKASNAKLRLDAASVLRFDAAQRNAAGLELEARR